MCNVFATRKLCVRAQSIFAFISLHLQSFLYEIFCTKVRSEVSQHYHAYQTETSVLIALQSVHMKVHDRPFACENPGCGYRGRYNKELHRHKTSCKASIHPVDGEGILYHCPEPSCKFSKERRHPGTRLDNLRRHIKTKHRKLDYSLLPRKKT